MTVIPDDGEYPNLGARSYRVFCPHCRTTNQPHHRVCEHCFRAMYVACPRCGTSMYAGEQTQAMHARACPKRPLRVVLKNLWRFWRRPPADYIVRDELLRLWQILRH